MSGPFRIYREWHGAYPDSLDPLVQPTPAGPPLLEGAGSAITDPWGRRFQFEVTPGPDGRDRIVVWTTDGDGDRIQWPRR